MEELNDNALVRQVIGGETDAYRELVRRHERKIFYLGLKFLHRDEDAEDFTQEVFLRAYERLFQFRGTASFGAWLYRLAYNMAVNQYHALRRTEEALELSDVADGNLEGLPDVELLGDELKDVIRNILEELPDTYNLVLKMHYFDGLSYREISEVFAVPENTVKSYAFRARKMVKQKMNRRLR